MFCVEYGLGRFGDGRLAKGGPSSCRIGGSAWFVHPAAWRDAGAGDAVHALSAQPVGDAGGDVGACRRADGPAGGGA